NRIGLMTTSGVLVTEFAVPTTTSKPFFYAPPYNTAKPDSIVVGPDGNVWFSENWASQIGRVTPDGVITEFPTPTPNSFPNAIVSGPDGNLWFTEQGGAGVGRVGRISPSGDVVEFTLDLGPAWCIAAGPDGKLWFLTGSSIQSMTTTGLLGAS